MNKAKPSSDALPSETVPDTSDIPEITNWSGAVRGKFYRPNAKMLVPVFVEPDVMAFLTKHAAKTKQSESSLANELLRRDIDLIQAVQP